MSYFDGLPKELLLEVCYYLSTNDIKELDEAYNLRLMNNKLIWINMLQRDSISYFIHCLDNDQYNYYESYNLFMKIRYNEKVENAINSAKSQLPALFEYGMEKHIKCSLDDKLILMDLFDEPLVKITYKGESLFDIKKMNSISFLHGMYIVMEYASRGSIYEEQVKNLVKQMKNFK